MPKNLGFYPAKNFTTGRGRWSGKQDIIVFHTTSGAAGLKAYENNPTKDPKKFSGSMAWFCSPTTTAQTSSQFIVDREGRYLQVVKFSDMAWCNGNNAAMRQYPGVRPIIKGRVDNANLYTYSIECEGYPAVGDPPSTDAQFEAMVEVMKLCIDDMYKNVVRTFRPDRDHIIGHCDIDPKNKSNCPSRNHAEKFPFDRFIAEAKKYCEEKYPGWIDGIEDIPVSPPVESNTVPGKFAVGDRVTIQADARWYDGKSVPTWVIGKIYLIDGLVGDKALLDKNGICSPISTRYLTKVVVDDQIGLGDKVTIVSGAKWWSGSVVPKWAIGSTYTVDELKGDRAVLSKTGINSPIHTKFLKKV